MAQNDILFVNSVQEQCGVFQYGRRTCIAFKPSDKYHFRYIEPTCYEELSDAINAYYPRGIIYNYHPLTMPWLNTCRVPGFAIKTYLIHHEGAEHTNLQPDYTLYADSMITESPGRFALPRPLFETQIFAPKSDIPVIGSFGFGFGNKNYGSIVKMVNEQFDEATIRLHIPRAYYGDREGEATAQILPGIAAEMKKTMINLEISQDFLDDADLLKFLAGNTLNIFLYDEMNGRGLSSTIDYALSVDTPIAINDSYMFRHIQCPEINVRTRTLQQIIDQGTAPLQQYREKWSHANFIKKYEDILTATL